MNKYEESELSASQAILNLIGGIENKEIMLWVDGNTGPFAIEVIDGSCTGKLTDMGETLEQAGVHVLLSPVEIARAGQSIWFVPEICRSEIRINYLSVAEEWYEQLNYNGQVKIRVNHYPMQANLTQVDWSTMGFLDYDLSIAGHYHGGQIRLPLIGALYIPSPTSGIMNGYFPARKEVKGLNQIADMQQYISAGLGSSASISFLDFRMFNTPEINVITLKSMH